MNERMYFYGKDTEENAEVLRGQPALQQHHRNHGCDEGNVLGRFAAGNELAQTFQKIGDILRTEILLHR